MANYYVSMAGYLAVAQWAATTAYTVGQYVRQVATLPTASNAAVFRCTVAGTSGASEPGWSTGSSSTTVDGTASWIAVGGAEAEQSAGNWKAPAASLAGLIQRWGSPGASDSVFFSDDHVTSSTTSLSLTYSGTFFSVKRGVGSSIPPAPADLNPGAILETVGTFDLTLGLLYAQGITFRAGRTSSGTVAINFSNAGTQLKNCRLELASTGSGAAISIGNSVTNVAVFWDNVTLKFGNTSQTVITNWGDLWWKNTTVGIDNTGSIPSILGGKTSTNGAQGIFRISGVDLSMLNTTIFRNASQFKGLVENCLLHASVGYAAVSGGNYGERPQIRISECSFTGAPDVMVHENNSNLTIDTRTNVYCSSGASDGVNNWCLRIRSSITTLNQLYYPFEMSPIAKRQNDTGLPKTFTIEAALLCASVPQKRHFYCDFHMLITSGGKLSSIVTTKDTDLDTTTMQTSTTSWDGIPRANSTAYVTNDVISVSSRPGEIFLCTTGGTTSGSLPAGYATATITTNVTDGAATFRLLQRVKFEVVATPRTRGTVRAYLRLGIPAVSSAVFALVDPKIRVT